MAARTVLVALAVLTLATGCVISTGTVRPVRTVPPPPPPGPGVSVDIGLFYDSLTPYGDWFLEADLGWVWTPYGVPVGWRPYTDGRWVLTDYGWTWVSTWDWGWAPFHYGRWTYLRGRGWVWVPGRVWAPAWVAWRWGDGYVGWAPLPPRIAWRPGVGLEVGYADLDRYIEVHAWLFIDERRFVDPRIRTYVVPEARNVTLVRVTRNVTRYQSEHGHVVVRGVNPDDVRRVGGRPVTRYAVRDVDRPTAIARDRIRGDELEIYRPEVREAEPNRTPPTRERGAASATRPSAAQTREETPAALERKIRQDQQELEREHRREAERPPQGVSREQLDRRQEQEKKALDEQAARERALLEARRKREEASAAGRGDNKSRTVATPDRKQKEAKAKEQEKKKQDEKKQDKKKQDKKKDGGAARTRRDKD